MSEREPITLASVLLVVAAAAGVALLTHWLLPPRWVEANPRPRHYGTWTTRHAVTTCGGCGECTHCIDEYAWMVKPSVWREAHPRRRGWEVCVACMEKRLGRRLQAPDFAWEVPLTTHAGYERSPRLIERMRPGADYERTSRGRRTT